MFVDEHSIAEAEAVNEKWRTSLSDRLSKCSDTLKQVQCDAAAAAAQIAASAVDRAFAKSLDDKQNQSDVYGDKRSPCQPPAASKVRVKLCYFCKLPWFQNEKYYS